ncbi:MAG: LysR family transcriptional regulator [Pseudomonadota bacterium]
MFNVKAMKAFVEVADLGSFTAAAKSMKVSTTSLSRLIADLEGWMETPLLRRSTRHVSLTDAGARYLDQCRAIVTAWEDLAQDAQRGARNPRGVLTVAGAAYSVRHLLAPHLPDFMRAYPDIRVRLDLRNDPADLVADAADVAFRLGEPADPTLIARKCGEVPVVLAAAPEVLQTHGAPGSAADLARFPCLLDTTPKRRNHWPTPDGAKITYMFEANDGEIVRRMMVASLGISMLPRFLIEGDIAAGRLTELFPGERKAALGVYFVLPERRQIVGTARAFVDFMSERVRAALA